MSHLYPTTWRKNNEDGTIDVKVEGADPEIWQIELINKGEIGTIGWIDEDEIVFGLPDDEEVYDALIEFALVHIPGLEVGREFDYIGEWVTIVECWKVEGGTPQAVIETRFGDRTTVDTDELSPKPDQVTK